MQKQLKDPKLTQADLLALKQKIESRAFYDNGQVRDFGLAEIVWKINSALYINPKQGK